MSLICLKFGNHTIFLPISKITNLWDRNASDGGIYLFGFVSLF